MLVEVRGARLAAMPAVPAGAWLVTKARAAYAGRGGLMRGSALAASWLAFSGLAQFFVPTALSGFFVGAPAEAARQAPTAAACYRPASFARLAQLPRGNVLAPMAIGARLLRYTPDGVVSAGYHRNVAGAYAVDDFLNGGEAGAAAIARQRGIAYVVVCDGLPQLDPRPDSATDSFVALWAEGHHWGWLTPLSPATEPIHIFKVELPP
jgi:hypothetical protein